MKIYPTPDNREKLKTKIKDKKLLASITICSAAVLGVINEFGDKVHDEQICINESTTDDQIKKCNKKDQQALKENTNGTKDNKKSIWDEEIPGSMHGMPTGAPY